MALLQLAGPVFRDSTLLTRDIDVELQKGLAGSLGAEVEKSLSLYTMSISLCPPDSEFCMHVD
jgi:hypothetical protein